MNFSQKNENKGDVNNVTLRMHDLSDMLLDASPGLDVHTVIQEVLRLNAGGFCVNRTVVRREPTDDAESLYQKYVDAIRS